MRLGRALLAGVAAGAARILIISVVAWITQNGGVDLETSPEDHPIGAGAHGTRWH